MTHEASNPEFKNSATDGTRIKHGYRKAKMAAKEHREHRADENQGKGGEINHEPCEKRKPFRRGMIGQTFTWEKAVRKWEKVGKKEGRGRVFPAFSHHFPAFPTFSHLIFFGRTKSAEKG